ncbi:MAG: thioredoxin [Candidatus Parvarchaeum acidophilus ARMAN-5]|jgi:thioredoxin 1|uniref:Thioredoxin n=1 Tax=Candidatus Parvarchaeum acidophilus ARMAN-5 TaxID=662762 RepID=D6GVS2_PARA5|nr:MAG: thioredoxin [Candidatus Parvarchaeum acidophilus ARMAN-5]
MEEIKSEEQFDKDVLKATKPVLVDLWAPWCMPCRWYSPIIEKVSDEMKEKFNLVKVNVDENQSIAAKYGVEAIPTTLLIEGGNVKASMVGAMQADQLRNWLNKNI